MCISNNGANVGPGGSPRMTSTLITTLLLAIIYLAIVRFVDMNEKEPLWAMLLVFGLGAGSGVAITMIASQGALELNPWASASIKELVKFLAIGAGVGVMRRLPGAMLRPS